MSYLDDLLKQVHGVEAQINPFDNGANYQSVTQQQAPQAAPMPPQMPAPSHQVPVGQSLTPQDIGRLDPQTQRLAQIYNQNPMDSRVSHIDPARFGYAPDGPVRPPLFPGGLYNQDGIQSIGGRFGDYGGTLGIDHGRLFGSYNKDGRILGQFGPQG